MALESTSSYRFDRFVLNLERGVLLVDGVEYSLRPKSFALLRHFIEHPGRLIDRDEIMGAVWPNVFVSDDSIAQCVKDVRRALGDDAQHFLRTVPKRGFLFTALMTGGIEAPPPSWAPAEIARPAPSLPDKPSIAVLPFQNMSGDPEQEYFADGMVEEIITALSRVRWLFVIARNSSFTYKGQAVDVKRVGRELGVRYVLEGSVRKGGNRVRIAGQLIDAETGAHLWADRFDGSLEDVFDLQDKIALSVSGVIEPALQAAEMRRSAARPTPDLTAYDLYLRALAVFFPITQERVGKALGLLEQAIEIDRQYGPALSLAAICHWRLVNDGWAEMPENSSRKGIDLARQALQVANNDPGILANAALVLAVFGEDIGAMIELVDRALSLNPSFARGWFVSGLLRLFAGEPDLAIEHVETSLRLSPRERTGQPLAAIGRAYFFKRQFDEAAAKLILSIQDHPGYPNSYRFLAACYAHTGRLNEARAMIAQLRVVSPRVIPSVLPFRHPEDCELLLAGLRLAMGDESVQNPGMLPSTRSGNRGAR